MLQLNQSAAKAEHGQQQWAGEAAQAQAAAQAYGASASYGSSYGSSYGRGYDRTESVYMEVLPFTSQ